MTAVVEAPPVLSLRVRLTQLAHNTARLGALDSEGACTANPLMVAALNEVTAMLGGPVDFDTVADLFTDLCGAIADLDRLEADRDGYLNRLGRPENQEQHDIVKGALLADREHYTARLCELAR